MAYLPIPKRGLRMEEGVQNTLKGGLLRQISEKWVIQQDIQASLGAHGLKFFKLSACAVAPPRGQLALHIALAL